MPEDLIAVRSYLQKRLSVALAVLGLCVLSVGAAGAEPPAIAQKQAEAQGVLARVQALDVQLEKTVEQYNTANVRLQATGEALKQNSRELAQAERSLHAAQHRLAARVFDLYTSSGGDSTLEIVLGARNLGSLIDELDAAHRIAAEDVNVLHQVESYRAQVARNRAALVHARSRQRQLVGRLVGTRVSIQSSLAERKQLLSSIQGEIVRLKAEEAARQARLRREAIARLAAERRAAAEAAKQAEAQRAAQAAAQQAAQQAATQQATTSTQSAPAPATTEAPAPQPPPTTAEQAPPPVSVPTSGGHPEVVGIAMKYLGVPYVWAGSSPSGFDCSGLVTYVFGQIGVSVPHSSYVQWTLGSAVSRDQLQPGDLVFFHGESHVGVYIGGGQFIHAPHTGDVVKISSLNESWYSSGFDGGRRI